MTAGSDVLWRINQDYTQRLTLTRHLLSLLLRLVNERGDDPALSAWMPVLSDADAVLTQLAEHHRDWRYGYFYDAAGSRRIVQSPAEVETALEALEHLRASYQPWLDALSVILEDHPRPEPPYTSVAQGDLWTLFARAAADLRDFGVGVGE
jgi:hypothetical protein